MGVYIKGMEMPISCHGCGMSALVDVSDGLAYGCQVLKEMIFNNRERLPNCPIIAIPPHGRLIDADALMHEFEKAQRTMAQHGREYSCSFMSSSQELSTEWYCVEDMLENAPTIIEAEEG